MSEKTIGQVARELVDSYRVNMEYLERRILQKQAIIKCLEWNITDLEAQVERRQSRIDTLEACWGRVRSATLRERIKFVFTRRI